MKDDRQGKYFCRNSIVLGWGTDCRIQLAIVPQRSRCVLYQKETKTTVIGELTAYDFCLSGETYFQIKINGL